MPKILIVNVTRLMFAYIVDRTGKYKTDVCEQLV